MKSEHDTKSAALESPIFTGSSLLWLLALKRAFCEVPSIFFLITFSHIYVDTVYIEPCNSQSYYVCACLMNPLQVWELASCSEAAKLPSLFWLGIHKIAFGKTTVNYDTIITKQLNVGFMLNISEASSSIHYLLFLTETLKTTAPGQSPLRDFFTDYPFFPPMKWLL